MSLEPRVEQFLEDVGHDGWDPLLPQNGDARQLEAALAAMRVRRAVAPRSDWNGRIIDERTPSGVPLRVYEPPTTDPVPIVVFMHGGGWVLGDLDMQDGICRALAAAGPVVVSVDYRLAPEHPFPAPLQDSEAAVRWAATEARRFRGDPDRLVVMGSSAGGNLAAGLAVQAQTDPSLAITRQVLVYPVLDSSMSTPSYRSHAQGYFLTAKQMQFYWDSYVPDIARRSDPRVSPAHGEHLAQLAPAVILSADLDPLRDEAESYATRLADAGVDVLYRNFPGMIHGFLGIAGLPAADQAIGWIADAVMGR